MNWLEYIKAHVPEHSKDVRLNLENVILRSTLEQDVALGCAIAAAEAAGAKSLAALIATEASEVATAASSAAIVMAQNNVWYPYVEMTGDPNLKGLPAQLRMTVIGTHGGTTKAKFEAFSLAASIVGKCHFCVKAHYETLKKEGYTVEQLRDIGRIAAVINSVTKCLVQ